MKLSLAGETRTKTIYIAGNPGYGKSSLIQTMALNDIKAGRGVCVIDPSGGDLVGRLVHWIPKERVNDTIYFDTDDPLPIDFFAHRNPPERRVLIDYLLDIFNLENAPISRPRLRRIINALLDANEKGGKFTFLNIHDFIFSESFRENVFSFAPHSREAWEPFPGKLTEYYTITERLSNFKDSPTLAKAVNGAPGVGINVWDIMQNKKILLVNLQQSPTDYFLASLIVSKIQQGIFGRNYIPKQDRVPFYAYVDECDRVMKFCAEDFGEFLIRARKFHLCLTMANPIPADLPTEFQRKFGAIGALIFFNLDYKDSKEFADRISPWESLADLKKFTALVCTRGSRPYLVSTPTFLGPSPASYAKFIQKRTVDNTPLHSPAVLHNEVNGNTDRLSEDIQPGPSRTETL
jgi:hypothetical protein